MADVRISLTETGTHSGRLTSDDRTYEGRYADFYNVELTRGAEFTVSQTSDEFDTLVYVVAPNGDVMMNDDWDGTNSRLSFITSEAGIYSVIASSYSAGATGSYLLSIVEGDDDSQNYGPGYYEGALSASDDVHYRGGYADYYYVYAYAGETISFSLMSDAFDCYAYLIDPYGEEVAYNDDGGEGYNSYIEYTVVTEGEHVFIATSYGAARPVPTKSKSAAAAAAPTPTPATARSKVRSPSSTARWAKATIATGSAVS